MHGRCRFCQLAAAAVQEALQVPPATTILTTGERPQAFATDSAHLAHGFLAVFMPEAAVLCGGGKPALCASPDQMARSALVDVAGGCTIMHTNKV